MLKYNYDTGQITRDFVFKKVEGNCYENKNHTKLIGVMCRTCPFYEGEKKFYDGNYNFVGHYVFCKYHKKDDEIDRNILFDMYDKFEYKAISHYYD